MGTGVSPKRIATSSSYPVLETAKSIPFRYSLITKQQNTSSLLVLRFRWIASDTLHFHECFLLDPIP